MSDLAEVLYPTMAAKPAPKPAQALASRPAPVDPLEAIYARNGTGPAPALPSPQDPMLAALYPTMAPTGGSTPPSKPAALEMEAPAWLEPNETFAEFKSAAGELGLDQQKAGRMLELHKRAGEAELAQRIARWENEASGDAEIGGQNMNASVGTARDLVREFGTPALTEALESTGLGSNPEVIRLLSRVGQALRAARGGR
jgi:hypothetical protein